MKRVTMTAQGYQKQNGSWLGKKSKSGSDGIHNGKEVESKKEIVETRALEKTRQRGQHTQE